MGHKVFKRYISTRGRDNELSKVTGVSILDTIERALIDERFKVKVTIELSDGTGMVWEEI